VSLSFLFLVIVVQSKGFYARKSFTLYRACDLSFPVFGGSNVVASQLITHCYSVAFGS